MEYTFQYETKMEREQIINDNQDKHLMHEKNIIEGNFLIFSDKKPIEIEIKELRELVLQLLPKGSNVL